MKPHPVSIPKVYRCTLPSPDEPVTRYVPDGYALEGIGSSATDKLMAGEDEDARLVETVHGDVEARWSVCAENSRYAGGNHPVVYTALTPAVAVSERSFWAIPNWQRLIPEANPVPGFVVCACSVRGLGKSYMRGWKLNRMLVHPHDYSFCQALARREAKRTRYLIVPSARHWQGKCVPVFRKGVIRCRTIVAKFDLEWDAANNIVYRRIRGRRYPVRIDPVYDMLPA